MRSTGHAKGFSSRVAKAMAESDRYPMPIRSELRDRA